MFGDGTTVDVDLKQARTYMKMAAESGEPYTMVEYATMLLQGEGGPKLAKEAVDVLTRAADNGDSTSKAFLGDYYISEYKYSMAKRWLEPAASDGDKQAQCSLGLLFYKGLGVKQRYLNLVHAIYGISDDNAFKLFKKSSDQHVCSIVSPPSLAARTCAVLFGVYA